MNDVLDILKRLPAECAIWGGTQGFLIRRGVMGMSDMLLATKNDVEAFNEARGVTPEQVRAMTCGCVNGWDADGAKVQTHTQDDPIFVYTAPFCLMLQVQAPTEEAAAQQADAAIKEVQIMLSTIQKWPEGVLTLTRDGTEIDLIETQS